MTKLLGHVFFLLCAYSSLALASSFASAAPAQSNQDDPDKNEQTDRTIYIPYEKLKDVFEAKDRGVFLPYEKFKQLTEAARKSAQTQVADLPPVGSVITEIDSKGEIGNEIFVVDANIKIELLTKGWHRIPLRLADAAIRKATIDGNEARIIAGKNGQHELVLENKDNNAQSITLVLQYAKSFTKTPGQSSVSFQSPQAPVNRWQIKAPESGINVQIEPSIAVAQKAATDSGNSPSTDPDNRDPESSDVEALIGLAPQVAIKWTPKSEGASGLQAIISTDTHQSISVEDSVLRSYINISYDISRAEVQRLRISIPDEQKVVNVFDKNIKRWSLDKENEKSVLNIELFEPAIGRQYLVLELERLTDQMTKTPIAVPQIEHLDVTRQLGLIMVKTASGLRADIHEKSGISQIDKSEIPKQYRNQQWQMAYRFASVPYDLKLNVSTVQPRLSVDQTSTVDMSTDRLRLISDLIYDVKDAGIFQVHFKVPDGQKLVRVQAINHKGFVPIQIDNHFPDPNQPDHFTVSLKSKAIGKVGIRLETETDLPSGLTIPSESDEAITVEIPRAAGQFEQSKGTLIVSSANHLQVAIGNREALTEQENHSLDSKRGGAGKMAFVFSEADPKLVLNVRRKKPQINAESVTLINIETGRISYTVNFSYEVKFSGVKHLRLDVPSAIARTIRSEDAAVRLQAMEKQPVGLKDGFTAMQISADREFLGERKFALSWEKPIDEIPLGEQKEFPIDQLEPQGTDRFIGQLAITKSDSIDVRQSDSAEGLRPIDPSTDLLLGQKLPNAAAAFEYQKDWKLSVLATRYELEELKRTSIPKALIRAVKLRQDQLSVQAIFQMRSMRQRLAIQMPSGFDPEKSFDDSPVRINGQKVLLERGAENQLFIPLAQFAGGKPFLLDIRYSVFIDDTQVELPSFPDEPGIQKVVTSLFVPVEDAPVIQQGPWTEENEFNGTTFDKTFKPLRENDKEWLDWIVEGIDGDHSALLDFATDGRPYVFSTVQPQTGTDGSLKVQSMNRTLLNGLVIGAIVLIGLLFVGRSLTLQLIVAALTLAGLATLATFYPLAARHILTDLLAVSFWFVGGLWGAIHVLKTGKSMIAKRRETAERSPPTDQQTENSVSNRSTEEPSEVHEINDDTTNSESSSNSSD